MQIIEYESEYTTEVNRSKFIVYLFPHTDYKKLQKKLRKEHPKANHIVYALRFLNEYEQIVENNSDDGEPKGCAGVPALNVMRGEKLINCTAVIVRYFGGIKLGTGGMARAYALAVKNIIDNTKFMPYKKKIKFIFATSYSHINKTLYQLKQLELVLGKRHFLTDKVEWEIYGEEENIEKLKKLVI